MGSSCSAASVNDHRERKRAVQRRTKTTLQNSNAWITAKDIQRQGKFEAIRVQRLRCLHLRPVQGDTNPLQIEILTSSFQDDTSQGPRTRSPCHASFPMSRAADSLWRAKWHSMSYGPATAHRSTTWSNNHALMGYFNLFRRPTTKKWTNFSPVYEIALLIQILALREEECFWKLSKVRVSPCQFSK